MMLGNLTLEEMQKRAGIEFPQELIEYMTPRRQQLAEGVKEGQWHCFDLPFTLVVGDMETVKEIYKHLQPLSSKFKEQMQISLSK